MCIRDRFYGLKEQLSDYPLFLMGRGRLDVISSFRRSGNGVLFLSLIHIFTVIGENNPDKEVLNAYLVYLHRMYKQKTVKRKIASVKALFLSLIHISC